MLITLCIVGLFLSFIIHIIYLIKYVFGKSQKHLWRFVYTGISNMILAIAISILAFYKPETVKEINVQLLVWISSGLMMLSLLGAKIYIFKNVYKRAQNSDHYHLNFFGKKVLHASVIHPIEFIGFMGSIPAFLLTGAFFITGLINFILYDHL
jgi:hypothetical protein